MPCRLLPVLALAVLALAGSPLEAHEAAGARRNLAQGRQALAERDYSTAVAHLKSAVSSFDPLRDKEELGDAWLQLGIAYLNGLGQPEEALPAFLASAAISPEPSTSWLWASVAAERLGRLEEAATYRTRAIPPPALQPPPAPTPAPAPAPQPVEEPVEEEIPSEKPDAVQHFFGEEEAEKAEPAPEGKPEEQGEAQEEKKKVDAFEYFFGEKEETAEEEPAEEKPPAAPRA